MILADDQLVALLVRIEPSDFFSELAGRWNLEAGFGSCDIGPATTLSFLTRDEGKEWVRGRLTTAFR